MWLADGAKSQERTQSLGARHGREQTGMQQRADFGGKGEARRTTPVVERLDSESVPSAPEQPAGAIVDCDRKHSSQPRRTGRSPAGIGPEHGFRVAGGVPWVEGGTQFLSNFEVIVYLAVQHDPIAGSWIVHRLMPGAAQIKNGKPGVREVDRRMT